MILQAATGLLGAGIGAILLAVVQAFFNRRKLAADTDKAGAEATSVLTAAALTLVQPLNDRIHELEGKLQAADDQMDRITVKAKFLEEALDASRAREEAGLAREAAKDALISELTRPQEETP